MKNLVLLFGFIASLFIIGCSSDDNDTVDFVYPTIEEYISSNNIAASETASGLKYVIDNPGNSLMPSDSHTVRFEFRQYFPNGQLISETTGDQIVFQNIRNYISGLKEGISLFGEGGSGTIFIPSELAFGTQGSQGTPRIPPNTDIIFDIELREVFPFAEEYVAGIDSLSFQQTPEGLYYAILDEGEGGSPTATSNVTVRYKGYYTTGEIFDQTTGDNTASFSLQEVIRAWQIGIPLMKTGGRAIFVCPNELAYGNGINALGQRVFVGYTDIVFEVELIEFR